MEMVLVLQWLHVHNADGLEGGSPAICFRPPGHQKVDTFRNNIYNWASEANGAVVYIGIGPCIKPGKLLSLNGTTFFVVIESIFVISRE